MVFYLAMMRYFRVKAMSVYTDPDHIRVGRDPGKIEGNMVFHYLMYLCRTRGCFKKLS